MEDVNNKTAVSKKTKKSRKNHKIHIMNILYKYKTVIVVVLPILILVCIRSFSQNHFKTDAKKLAEPSLLRSNIINIEKSGNLEGNRLLIYLDKNAGSMSEISFETLNVLSDSILSHKYLNRIKKHKGPVLLYSSDTGVSSRIWMILSQLGISNIYILTKSSGNEVFKNEFRPDTLIGPEL